MTDEVLDAGDGLLQSQWREQFVPDFFDVPERRLLLAVLMDALHTLRKGSLTDQKGVLTWIRGQDARFTFQDVCDGLALDAQRVATHMVEENRTTPVPRRRRAGRKAQSPGRRASRGAGVPVKRDPTPAPLPGNFGPAGAPMNSESAPNVSDGDSRWLAAAG